MNEHAKILLLSVLNLPIFCSPWVNDSHPSPPSLFPADVLPSPPPTLPSTRRPSSSLHSLALPQNIATGSGERCKFLQRCPGLKQLKHFCAFSAQRLPLLVIIASLFARHNDNIITQNLLVWFFYNPQSVFITFSGSAISLGGRNPSIFLTNPALIAIAYVITAYCWDVVCVCVFCARSSCDKVIVH